jgi:ABC-type phosphate/phosphonate transport system substrate-binding protein
MANERACGIASFRMYNATESVARAWAALFGRVFADLGLPVEVVPHAWPASLVALWQRTDLVCGFMCGLPFVEGAAAVVPLAVPVPSPARYDDQPRYLSELLVREDSGWLTLPQTFGARFGWMARHSQSGYHAARAMLAPHAAAGQRLYEMSVGPLDTPARALDALRDRRIDVTALDGYYLDLLRRHAPERLSGLRTIATTPWTPNPLLVASASQPEDRVAMLRAGLVRLHRDPSYTHLLADVLVRRFAEPQVASYGVIQEMGRESPHYPEIA